MRLTSLSIKNFRAIKEVSLELTQPVSVIVGPNAVGKTTILEAIRLAKGLLAPRTGAEPQQVLISLGAVSPQMPQRIMVSALSQDAAKPVEIKCAYMISEREMERLIESSSQIAMNLLQARLGQAFGNPTAIIQYMSSEQGKESLQQSEREVEGRIAKLGSTLRIDLDLVILPNGAISGSDILGQNFFSFLEQDMAPDKSLFSYYPADRAMPYGEPAIQFGAADAAQQMESYNSQPQLKYGRLKGTVFGAIVQSNSGRSEIESAFKRVFDAVLRGRHLDSIGINQNGMLAIMIQETATGRKFSIDSMSSGEKGLLLTFLLMQRSIQLDGIVMLDEPELHLNPAVCRDVLNFIISDVIEPRRAQLIVCSHSAEILASALDRNDSSLFHLRSEDAITLVRSRDQDEVADALHRLGTSAAENLLYKGTLYVEGIDDVDLLQIGFEDILRRYKVKGLGGRTNVVKEIKALQEAEKKGADLVPSYFIFDLDRKPEDIQSSDKVLVLQWKRRCIENYLLDIDSLTDVLKDPDVVRTPLQNMGDVARIFKEVALTQLLDTAAADVYQEYKYEDPCLRKGELVGKSLSEIGNLLFSRLERIRDELSALSRASWVAEFERRVNIRKGELEPLWEQRWIDICDGKRLFQDVQQRIQLNQSLQKFKRTVMLRLRLNRADSYVLMESLIRSELKL